MLTYDASRTLCLQSRTANGRILGGYILQILRAVTDYDKVQTALSTREKVESTLIEHNMQWPLVYLADVFVMEGDELLVYKKIGCTQDIANRQLARDMHATCTFTHVFRCIRALPLEQDVLKVPIVVKHLYNQAINGHMSRETIKFSEEFQETDLIQLIKERVDKYNTRSEESDLRAQELANDRDKLDLMRQVAGGNGSATTGQQFIVVTAPAGGPGLYVEHKPRKNIRGYRVQQIDPQVPNRPFKVYESAQDACCSIKNASKSRIISALNHDTLYMGFRWCRVAHDLDPQVVHNLPPLQHMRVVTQGMVAKLDQNYVIKEVFRNQKDATAEAQLKSRGAISVAIKKGSLSRGHYYKRWDDCTLAEKEAYIEIHGEPETPENRGIRVSRNDSTGRTFGIYANVEAVTKVHHMSRQTLFAAIRGKTPTHGWYWAFTDRVNEVPDETPDDCVNDISDVEDSIDIEEITDGRQV